MPRPGPRRKNTLLAYWRGQDYVLRLMAAVHTSHPDYDPSWQPVTATPAV